MNTMKTQWEGKREWVTNGSEAGPLDGIEELRRMVNLFNNTTESFNQRYTVEQLVLIYRAYQRSEWDITPDYWTPKEVKLALEGKGTGATSERP
jgi:hypothetical protein